MGCAARVILIYFFFASLGTMRASDKLGPRMAGQICAGYEIIQLHTSLHIPGERIGMRE